MAKKLQSLIMLCCSKSRGNPARLIDFPQFRWRIALIYAKQCAEPFSRLSSNVLREVSAFLWFRPRLYIQHGEIIWSFDPVAWNVREECLLPSIWKKEIQVAAVCFGENDAFIQTKRILKAREIDALLSYTLRDRCLKRVDPINRCGFGAIYDPPRMRICFFGGSFNATDTRQCDQLLLRTEEWRKLPKMHRAKSCFSPCWFRGKVYMCYDHVEVFHPQSDTYELLPNVSFHCDIRFPFYNFAIPNEEEILLIYRTVITSWRPGSQTMRKVCSISYILLGQYAPVLAGDWVFCPSPPFRVDECAALNIRDGEKKMVLRNGLNIEMRKYVEMKNCPSPVPQQRCKPF